MNKNKTHKITAVLLALLFWQIIAMILNMSFLLSSPLEVAKALFELGLSIVFWKLFDIYISPYITVIRSVPVASFVIIILIGLGSEALSVLVCFFMVMPIFYANTLEGLKSVDIKMLQMAKIFKLGKKAKVIYIYLPAMESFLVSSSVASMGIAFKSGIAAEVIGRPKDTLGYFLFDAKIYLETSKVFAITFMVILCSAIFERAVVFIAKRFFRLIKRVY